MSTEAGVLGDCVDGYAGSAVREERVMGGFRSGARIRAFLLVPGQFFLGLSASSASFLRI